MTTFVCKHSSEPTVPTGLGDREHRRGEAGEGPSQLLIASYYGSWQEEASVYIQPSRCCTRE